MADAAILDGDGVGVDSGSTPRLDNENNCSDTDHHGKVGKPKLPQRTKTKDTGTVVGGSSSEGAFILLLGSKQKGAFLVAGV